MSNLWERFDTIVTPSEVTEAKNKFTPIEPGDYNAILEELQPGESKNGLPMLKGKFRTIEGNKVIFYNQMLQNLSNPAMTAVNVAEAVTFLGAVLGEDVEFQGLAKLADLVTSVPVGGEYVVNVSYGKNDYDMKFPKLKLVQKVEGYGDD